MECDGARIRNVFDSQDHSAVVTGDQRGIEVVGRGRGFHAVQQRHRPFVQHAGGASASVPLDPSTDRSRGAVRDPRSLQRRGADPCGVLVAHHERGGTVSADGVQQLFAGTAVGADVPRHHSEARCRRR